MAALHRILAVDSTSLVPNITQAVLDLLERGGVVIRVQSGSAALAELARGAVSLVVIGHALDDMSGMNLARQIEASYPGLPVILLASTSDRPEGGSSLAPPLYRLVRAEDGERFVHVLSALLDGRSPSTRPTPAVPVMPLEDLGPVPDVDAASLTDNLSGILTDVGAMAVVLIDRTGRILSEVGAVGYLDREQLTATLAPVFAHMVHIKTLIGGDRPQAMHFYDGDAFDIFALAVGLHHFICLIFEGSAGSRAFGAVTMFGRRAVQDMLQTIGDDAFELILASDQPEKSRRKSSRKRKTQEISAAETQASAEQDDASARAATLDPLPDDTDLETMLAGIDSIDLSAVDDLFDPDKLAEIAVEKEKLTARRMSYDEAQKLGVIRKD